MRFAAIADIHGNLPALEAVLADIARRGADFAVNLGDLVSGPLWPAETAGRLMGLGLPTIRGNCDRQIATFEPQQMGLSDAYARQELRPDHLAWLACLPPVLRPRRRVSLPWHARQR
jgi:predicted phosphodiesterase